VDELMLVSQFFKANVQNINPAIIFDLQKYHPNAWQIFKDFKQNFILQHILRNLRKGVEEGLYREDIDVEVMARLRLEEVQLGFDNSVFPLAQFNIYDTQIQLLEHFIRGIVTEEGLALFNQYRNREQTPI
jgi:hypothetical protein